MVTEPSSQRLSSPQGKALLASPQVISTATENPMCSWCVRGMPALVMMADRKSTRLNSSHLVISYAVFCLKKKNISHVIENDVEGAAIRVGLNPRRVEERSDPIRARCNLAAGISVQADVLAASAARGMASH